MTKKLLSLIVVMVMVGTVTVVAQTCTPDPIYTEVGIYPDTLVGLPCAQTTVLYETTMTLITPTDSLYDLGPPFGTILATIDSIVVQDNTGDGIAVNGLPPGVNYQCDPPSCSWPGGSAGCILLIGTPLAVGTFNLIVEVDAYVTQLGSTPINMDKVDQYTIVVSATAPPSAAYTKNNATQVTPFCNGDATASGGVTYQWDNAAGGGTAAMADSLCPGVYSYAAIDVAGCAGVDTVTIGLSVPCVPTVTGFTSNAVGLSVVFTDASTDATSWAWDFGDGTTSTMEDPPTHVYAVDSTYNVCLFTSNACSSDSICDSVTAGGACTPPVAGINNTPNDLTVSFADGSTDATAWVWDFADGTTSTVANPSHTYAAAGTYNVCLKVTNPCGADSTCTNVTVTHVGVEQIDKSFNVVRTVPNPFSGTTNITFDLVEPGIVNLVVIDRIGKVIYAESVEGTAGVNAIEFSAEGIAPGIYMYNLVSGVYSVTGKMTVVK